MRKNIFKLIVILFLLSNSLSVLASVNDSSKNNAILFVSLGMPKLVLRQYLMQSKKFGIPLVIRGLLNNSYPDTAKRIYQILHPKNSGKKSISGGFEIDPVYFRKFQIHVVPALVINSDAHSSVVYGNIPIQQLLQLIVSKSKYPAIKNDAALYLEKYHA